MTATKAFEEASAAASVAADEAAKRAPEDGMSVHTDDALACDCSDTLPSFVNKPLLDFEPKPNCMLGAQACDHCIRCCSRHHYAHWVLPFDASQAFNLSALEHSHHCSIHFDH